MSQTIKANKNNIIGRMAVIKTFKMAVDGANNVIFVLVANQSNERRLSDPVPSCCTGKNMLISAAGNFILYENVAVIICK